MNVLTPKKDALNLTWAQRNPELNRQRVKKWYNEHVDEILAYKKEWLELNYEHRRQWDREYKRRQRDLVRPKCGMAGCRKPVGFKRYKFCTPHGRQNEADH